MKKHFSRIIKGLALYGAIMVIAGIYCDYSVIKGDAIPVTLLILGFLYLLGLAVDFLKDISNKIKPVRINEK